MIPLQKSVARLGQTMLAASLFVTTVACRPADSVRTVSLRIRGNLPNAEVTIDDRPVGPLGYVAAKGVALPPGAHRITAEHRGYFPWDRLIYAERDPILLTIELVQIPE